MREQILYGTLELPSYSKFVSGIGQHYTELANRMFTAAWRAYLKDKSTINLIYWADRFNNAKVFNLVLLSLSDANWLICDSIPARNWAEARLNEDKLLEFCTPDELESVRSHKKFVHYRLVNQPSVKSTATRVNGTTKNTGLVRQGFCDAGNSQFTYDQAYMSEYADIIRLNLTKSMTYMATMYPAMRHDQASYDVISSDILDYYLTSDEVYSRGNNFNDSRGRAISSSLSKVGNPISCKDFRALIVLPTTEA